MNVRLARAGDRATLASLVQQTVFYGRAVIGPAAVVVVLAGIAMVVQSGLHMRTLWIEWGLFVVFLVFFFGGMFAARHGAVDGCQ